MNKITRVFLLFTIILLSTNLLAQKNDAKTDWEDGRPEGCTTIMVGKLASFDGSVMTSHTDDSHRDRTWMDIEPSKKHKDGSVVEIRRRFNNNETKMPSYKFDVIGNIPQVDYTYSYINTAYPCMNEKQLAIGESTFGGRDELQSDEGLIDCYQLVHLMLQRCTTAREAIELARVLLDKYGWNDYGEVLTIADKNEAWVIEIVGPGKGKVGANWVAQRVPDNHVTVNANASRVRKIDLDNPDYFKASKNVEQTALDSSWWNPENGEYEFCYAYDPSGRASLSSRRREWRVLSLVAPSLGLSGNSENYPFSVEPEEKVTLNKMVSMFQDYYEGTPFNFIKDLTAVNEDGKTEISPMANPFMPYDMNKMLRINGGWSWRGERTIARWYTNYGTITQSRDWLVDEIGGVVWFAWDNIATSVYVPIYCSTQSVPESYKVKARHTGYTRKSAWWGFNRLSTIAAHRWGEMRYDVTDVWNPIQNKFFEDQDMIEEKAKMIYKKNPQQVRRFLTEYFIKNGNLVFDKAWELGDNLWTKYDEKF